MESGPPVGQIYTMYIDFPLMGIPYPINQAAVAPHFLPPSTKGALETFRHFQKQVVFAAGQAWRLLSWGCGDSRGLEGPGLEAGPLAEVFGVLEGPLRPLKSLRPLRPVGIEGVALNPNRK